MPTYSLVAAEIQTDIRALPVTVEPILSAEERAMSETDRELMEACFHQIREGTAFAIRNLRKLVRRYPEVVSLKNHLNVAYSAAGRDRESHQLTRRIIKEHPDYLFARLNVAGELLEDKGDAQRIPDHLGPTLRLGDLQPDRDCFHVSEVHCYYHIVALFHLRHDRSELAKAIHDTLADLEGVDESKLQQLSLMIGGHNLERMQERMEEEDARAIKVTMAPPRPSSGEMFAPGFCHPQIDELYHHDFGLPDSSIAEILALPRQSLIADLEKVLGDGIERGPLYFDEGIDYQDEESWFPLHAVFLLGELKAGESLPVVLEFLSQHPDVLDFWFGLLLFEELWDPLYNMIEGRLDQTTDWMLSPGVSSGTREVLAVAACQMARHQPECRAEVIDWNRRILEYLLVSPPEDNILDTDLVTGLVWQLLELGAAELLPLIQLHWEKGYIAPSQVGDIDDIARVLAEADGSAKRRPRLTMAERYRGHREASAVTELGDAIHPAYPQLKMPEMPSLADFPELEAAAPFVRDEPKVGRNDPCPCGSGKKYKKCCL